MTTTPKQIDKARRVFRRCGGILRTSEAIRAGIQPGVLYAMRDTGAVKTLARGCYRLADLGAMTNPDLAVAAKAVPKGVVCLLSALSFHNITTQIPRAVHLALPEHTQCPRISYPPIQAHWFRGGAYTEGIETRKIDGVQIRIYSPAKTVADCFKFRNKIGLDVAIEALKLCRQRNRTKGSEFLEFARVCRVEHVMGPYLEAIL